MWVAIGGGDGTFQAFQPVINEFGCADGRWKVDKNSRFAVDLTGSGAAGIVGFGNGAVWASVIRRERQLWTCPENCRGVQLQQWLGSGENRSMDHELEVKAYSSEFFSSTKCKISTSYCALKPYHILFLHEKYRSVL